jgi:hypothetical protein
MAALSRGATAPSWSPTTMTLLENERRRSHRAQRKHEKQVRRHKRRAKPRRPSALDRPLSILLDSQVLTFFEWCRLNRFSERTGRRILKSGRGPPVVQLSTQRIGITVGANKQWQQSLERA